MNMCIPNNISITGGNEMEELIKLVVQKANISEAQARTAVTTVVSFLKERLPAPIAGQVDNVLNNPGVAGTIGGLFGGKK
jgi:uncharacterized protein (DUF2267 family)